MMIRFAVALVAALSVFPGCTPFYRPAPEGAPAATLTETSERRGLAWFQTFALSEIDERPVSHIGKSTITVRVPPGERKLLIHVQFRHDTTGASLLRALRSSDGDCPCEAWFPVIVDLSDGQRLKIDGTILPGARVKVWLADVDSGERLTEEIVQQARSIPRTISVVNVAPGIYVPIQTPR